ncbi:MAG: hypothetical protein H0U84_02035 [Thermoleophilaceae bacterium]|nr:hypothetical protein [Thermoleophilaceae bacterium]
MPDADVNEETERDPTPQESQQSPEDTGAKNDDNPTPPDDAGQKGAGSEGGAIGGLEHGTEPEGEDIRQHERP